MSSAKWRPFCLGLNVLTQEDLTLQLSHEKMYAMEAMNGHLRFVK